LILSIASILLVFQVFHVPISQGQAKISTESLYVLLSGIYEGSSYIELPVDVAIHVNSSSIRINGKEVVRYNQTMIEVSKCYGAEVATDTFTIKRLGDTCRIMFTPLLNLSSGELVVVSAVNNGSFRRLYVSTKNMIFKSYIDTLNVGAYTFYLHSPLILKVKIVEVAGG